MLHVVHGPSASQNIEGHDNKNIVVTKKKSINCVDGQKMDLVAAQKEKRKKLAAAKRNILVAGMSEYFTQLPKKKEDEETNGSFLRGKHPCDGLNFRHIVTCNSSKHIFDHS